MTSSTIVNCTTNNNIRSNRKYISKKNFLRRRFQPSFANSVSPLFNQVNDSNSISPTWSSTISTSTYSPISPLDSTSSYTSTMTNDNEYTLFSIIFVF